MLSHEYRTVSHCVSCCQQPVVRVIGRRGYRVYGNVGIPKRCWIRKGFMHTNNKWCNAELPLGCTPRPDSQTWMSSCDPSFRCVWSQQGGCTPITATLSRHRFSLCPPDHSHNCRPPVCHFQWSLRSRLSPVVRFRLSAFESISSSSRRIDARQQLCQFLSRCCVSLRFIQTRQHFHVCLYQILRCWPEFSRLPLQTALAPKPWWKKVKSLSNCTTLIPAFIIPGCP